MLDLLNLKQAGNIQSIKRVTIVATLLFRFDKFRHFIHGVIVSSLNLTTLVIWFISADCFSTLQHFAKSYLLNPILFDCSCPKANSELAFNHFSHCPLGAY